MSMPCDTGLCNPERCTDSLCPTGLEMRQLSPCISKAEEEARKRGAEQYVKEHTFTPSQLLLDIRLHNTDRNLTSNNVFWRRYLESRKMRIPGSIYICVFKQLSDWADRETIKRLREDMEHYKHNIEDAIE